MSSLFRAIDPKVINSSSYIWDLRLSKECAFPQEITVEIIESSGMEIIEQEGEVAGDLRGKHVIASDLILERNKFRIFIYGTKTIINKTYAIYHDLYKIKLKCYKTSEYKPYEELNEKVKNLKIKV